MPLAAVLFDLDGTLVDSERDNVESVVLAARRWGRELDAEDRQFIVGHSWNEIHARIVRRHGIDVTRDVLIAAAEDNPALGRGPVRELMVRIFNAIGPRSPEADDYRGRLRNIIY